MSLFPLLLLFSFPFISSHNFPEGYIDYYFFEGVSDDFVDWYMNFTYPDGTFEKVVTESEYYGVAISGASVPIMALHLTILTRKSMMTSSTNIFLIAITVGDVAYLIGEIFRYSYKKYWSLLSFEYYYRSDYCYIPPSYLVFSLKWYYEVFRDYLNRCSAWCGLLLTVVRCMAIKTDNRTLTSLLISTRFGWKAIMIISIACLLMPILEVQSHKIVLFNHVSTGPNCEVQRSDPTYQLQIDNSFSIPAVAVVDTWMFQIIPSVIVALFTFLLISELARVKRRSISLGSERVQTTKINVLVFLLAVCFVFVRGFQAIVTSFAAWANGMMGFRDMTIDQLPVLVNLLFIVNGLLHFLICVSLSSQYRDTARKMFNIEQIKVRSNSASTGPTIT